MTSIVDGVCGIPMMNLIFTYIIKIVSLIIHLLNIGAGYVWPGHLVLKIYPKVLSPTLFSYPHGVVLISGTNGKTTTSKLISHILRKVGLEVVCNESGANLINGIITAIFLDRNLLGKPRADVGVFEVDEFNLPFLLEVFSPKVLVLLNLSRDQLDRYGETDIILDKWKEALSSVDAATTLVIDPTQENFKSLPGIFKGKTQYFESDPDLLKNTDLRGEFNAKNVSAALQVAQSFGIDKAKALEHLTSFHVAYGRGETINYAGKSFSIFLAKNPSSFNINLETLSKSSSKPEAVLVVLNDNIPDGRDVSWIYDIKTKSIREGLEGLSVFVAGTRSYDMAIRLNYAGLSVEEEHIFSDLDKTITWLAKSSNIQNVVVLPNYSAMLETRKILLGREIL